MTLEEEVVLLREENEKLRQFRHSVYCQVLHNILSDTAAQINPERKLPTSPMHDERKWFSIEEWIALPISLRQEYWQETDYNEHPPSKEFLERAYEYLEKRK
jgi:hypothetical protein